MKEQLISFETAKLAKEKGLDIECYAYYRENVGIEYSGICYSDSYYEDLLMNYNNQKLKFSAPNQSLLQKWLREIKHLSILVYMNSEINYYYVIYPIDERCNYKGSIISSNELYSNDYERCNQISRTKWI